MTSSAMALTFHGLRDKKVCYLLCFVEKNRKTLRRYTHAQNDDEKDYYN